MAKMEMLSGEEAARRLSKAPDTLGWPIGDFMTQFGLSWEELRAELGAGRLTAQGTSTSRGFKDVHITATAVLSWLANPSTPEPLVRKVDNFAFRRSRPS